MKQILSILFLISCFGLISCSEKNNLNDGYYFSTEELDHLIYIKSDTLIFENILGIDTFTYLFQGKNQIILSPINIKDSIIIFEYNFHSDGLELFVGDTLMRFKQTSFNNATDFYINSKGFQINVPYFENPQFIAKQNLVVTLLVATKNDSLELELDENQTDIGSIKNDFQSALDKFDEVEKPLVTLRLFVDKDFEVKRLEPILRKTTGLFREIAFVVKPSFKQHKRYGSQYFSFFDYVFFANDSIHIKFIDKHNFQINTKDNINSNSISAKMESAEYTFIKLLLKDGMSVQEYIEVKNVVYSTIDSLRDKYSLETVGCLFNEIDSEIEHKNIREKYPRLVIIENEK
ncbi:hypothetical protein [Maribellus maritimus]|uniref:hypothetical protein n=1 Tax=Maribellus maritimus TaxID=2870838 RepID=UPI001EEBBF12|nr:hypothetical protein [Maribellus maritimus]MCG6187451.1 hypothetical protein [Maribellus maritimus]